MASGANPKRTELAEMAECDKPEAPFVVERVESNHAIIEVLGYVGVF